MIDRRLIALRYGCAVVSVALAIGVRRLMDPWLGDAFPFATVFFAILVTAWFGGFKPAAAAVILGGFAADYFLLPPRGSFGLLAANELVGLVLYVCTGLGIAILGGSMHAARELSEANAKNLEERVRERTASVAASEARMAGIVGSAMDAIISVDGAQKIVLFNAAAEKLFQCAAADALGKPLDRFMPQSFREHHRQHVEDFGKTGITSRSLRSLGALTGLRTDGLEFPIEASISQIEVAGEKIYTVILRDITERQQAEKASVLLTAIVDSSFDAIIGKDLNSIVTSWNAGAEKMFGYSADEMIGRSITVLIPPDHQQDEEKILSQIKRGESVQHFDTVRVRKDGSLLDVSVTVSPIKDAGGEIIGASKVARDISERKKIEIALCESEERFSRMFNSSPVAASLSTLKDGRYLDVNDAFLKMFQRSRDEVVGHTVHELNTWVDLQQRAALFAVLEQNGVVHNFEMELRAKSGHLRHILWSGVQLVLEGETCLLGSALDITERKAAEEELRLSHDRMRLAAEATGVGIWEWNVLTNTIRWDALMFRIYGVAPTPDGFVEYRTWADAVLPEDLRAQEEVLQDTLRRIGRSAREFRIRRRNDGEVRHIEAVETARTNAQGQAEWVVGTNLDVTERRNSERALREKELQLHATDRRLAEIIQGMTEACFALDTEWRFTFVNDRSETLLRHRREQMIGKTIWEVFYKLVGTPMEAHYRRAMTERVPVAFEVFSPIAERWLDIRLFPTPEGLAAFLLDIHERKQVEAALEQSRAEFKDLFDNAPAGYHEVDAEGRLARVNQTELNMLGYTEAELIGQPVWKISAEDEVSRRAVAEKLRGITPHEAFERRLKRKDGSSFPVLIEDRLVRGSDGQVAGIRSVIKDITERKQAEEAIQKLNAELEQRVIQRTAQLETANKELESFSYSVSHDLRAPLRAVNGFAGIVINEFGAQLPAEAQKYLERIRNGGQRMGELIDDLLAFSRLGRQAMKRQAVDSARLVQAVLDESASQREGRKIELRVGKLPVFNGDPALFKQVWVNLVSNAIKYSRGREPAVIEIGCEQTNGESVFFVRDNGTGFDMQYVHKLFGVFQRLHRADEFEGTGVGLAIVQRIVHRHGGRVWAEAGVDTGATFYFTIPEENKT